MRLFGLRGAIFGRKGAASEGVLSPLPATERGHRGGETLTVADLRARCVMIAQRNDRPAHSYLHQVINAYSPEERGALLASIAPDVEAVGRYSSDPTASEYWTANCHGNCLRQEVCVSPDQLPALLTLLVDNKQYEKYYTGESFKALLRLINQAIRDGGFLTSTDIARLSDFSAMLRAHAGKERDKPKQKVFLKRAEVVEKLGNLEVSATSLLMERCEGAHNPHALGDEPPHLAFWSALLASFATGLHEIKDSLHATKAPGWMKDQTTFAATWPAVGPMHPRFAAWTEGPEQFRDFAVLRGFTKRRGKGNQLFVQPERIQSLPQLRAHYGPTFEWMWNTLQIPAIEQLADLERPGWTELLEHLITARMAPRPTAAWRKQAVKLTDAIGRGEVVGRLQDWLTLFHAPALTPVGLADRINAEAMDHQVATLNEALPDWPQRIAPDEMIAVGRALAMVAASGAEAGLPKVFVPNFIECNDHCWEGKRASEGKLRLTHTRWMHMPCDWLHISLENEALLRGAVWLATAIMERDRAIALLEAMALAASARLRIGDSGQRSKIVANAVIATLIDLSGVGVDAAIYRLSQAIPDRTINAPLFKALNRPNLPQPTSE